MSEERYDIPGISGLWVCDEDYKGRGIRVLYNGCVIHEPFKTRDAARKYAHEYALEAIHHRILDTEKTLAVLRQSQVALLGDVWNLAKFRKAEDR